MRIHLWLAPEYGGVCSGDLGRQEDTAAAVHLCHALGAHLLNTLIWVYRMGTALDSAVPIQFFRLFERSFNNLTDHVAVCFAFKFFHQHAHQSAHLRLVGYTERCFFLFDDFPDIFC